MTDALPDAAATLRRAQEALGRKDASQARAMLYGLIATNRASVDVWLAMAHAAMLLNDASAKSEAIDKALALAPTDVRALIAKADHLAMQGDQRAAAAYYSTALQVAPPPDQTPAGLREALQRARAARNRLVRDLEDFVRAKLAEGGVDEADAPPRFSRAVDILFGRKRAYVQQPRYLYYPDLPNIQFYDRALFTWLDPLEGTTDVICEELRGLEAAAFAPYVTQAPGRPRNDQMGMAGNPDWSALFLYKDGAEQPAAAHCPATLAALADAPLTHIPRRTPSILFSRLAGRAHIPPHTGMLNTRLICHLALVVPESCVFRVGHEERIWSAGKAWVFDDSIEHEAWNRSAHARTILIFDIWRPELSLEERACVSMLCQAIDAFQGGGSWDA